MTKEFFDRGKQIAKWADNNMTKDEALEPPAWQGLSDDEIQSVTWKVWGADALEPELDYARAIEQALKEKNS